MNVLYIQFLMLMFAGWVNRSQQDVIEYLQAENRVLREQLGGKRILFTDSQRRRLANKAKLIGTKRLLEIGTIVTPDTLLRWYRQFGAKSTMAAPRGNQVGPRPPPRLNNWFCTCPAATLPGAIPGSAAHLIT